MTTRSTIHVFVTAHPDDESLFFLPTIRTVSDKIPKWIVCLSNGNYDGLGSVREIELHRACGALGFHKVICLDDPDLQDNPTVQWSSVAISKSLRRVLLMDKEQPQQQQQQQQQQQRFQNTSFHIITFDRGGVSGHPNHRDVCIGVGAFLQDTRQSHPEVVCHGWELETVRNPLVKYLPIWHWIVLVYVMCRGLVIHKIDDDSLWLENLPPRQNVVTCTSYRPQINWKCMAMHASQFVWYRRLFLVFSVYTYVNQLRRMKR